MGRIKNRQDAHIAVQHWMNDIWSRGDEQAMDEYLSPDFEFVLSFSHSQGLDAFKKLVRFNRNAFENLTYRAEDADIVSEDDKAAAYWTMYTERHRSTWQGVEATGREVSIHGLTLFDIKDGMIVRARVISDFYGMLDQLGAVQRVTPATTRQPEPASPAGRG